MPGGEGGEGGAGEDRDTKFDHGKIWEGAIFSARVPCRMKIVILGGSVCSNIDTRIGTESTNGRLFFCFLCRHDIAASVANWSKRRRKKDATKIRRR